MNFFVASNTRSVLDIMDVRTTGVNGKLSSEAGCPWPQYLLKAKVSCGSVAML